MKPRIAALAAALVLAACASQPSAPSWQADAHDSLARFVNAYLKGDEHAAAVEFDHARASLSSTGPVALVARAELTRCAAQVASLAFETCDGFEKLRGDAPAAERAYADYLEGRVTPAEVPLLPEQHRAIASGREDASALTSIADPVAQLVGAGVLLRTGRASPQVVQAAVDTASREGWRRPLLAWLAVQLKRAEHAGARDETERLRRRIDLVGGSGTR
jgi:hypothetical protein